MNHDGSTRHTRDIECEGLRRLGGNGGCNIFAAARRNACEVVIQSGAINNFCKRIFVKEIRGIVNRTGPEVHPSPAKKPLLDAVAAASATSAKGGPRA